MYDVFAWAQCESSALRGLKKALDSLELKLPTVVRHITTEAEVKDVHQSQCQAGVQKDVERSQAFQQLLPVDVASVNHHGRLGLQRSAGYL